MKKNIVINSNPVTEIFGRITNQSKPTLDDRLEILRKRLSNAEITIENYERLRGFELELSSMRLSFNDWSALVDDTVLKEKGIGLIIDMDEMNQAEIS